MKAHTSGFKDAIKQLGRQLKGIISYDNTILETEIISITPHYEANLLKSVMKQLDLELSVDIPLETVINCQIGIYVGNDYEMLNFGNYVVYSSEKQEDTNTYKIVCYDKMLYSMKQNEDLEITYPITISNYLIALGNKIGLSVANTTFYNSSLTIPSELYLGQEYTYRDILDEIAQATGSIIFLNTNDEIVVKYPTLTSDTIDEEFLKDTNVVFKEKYGPINSIVLSRSGESDNVYLQDTESVEENGLCEVKIVDNQIMNFNNRSDFLQGILNALDGIEYYKNNLSSFGVLYYEVGDFYNVSIGENIYQCLMLNDEIKVTTGIEEIIHTDIPEQSETDYSKADKTDMKINKTYLIVDKQNQTIESVVSNVTTQNNKIARVEQTVDEINSKISDIADITTYGESDSAYVELEEINQSEPIMIKVHPTATNISYLYPRANLYPSNTQYLSNRIIRFVRTYEEDGETLTENIDYEIPDDLLRYNSEIYDEFYLDYDSQTCQVIKRCAYNTDGTVIALGTEIVTNYPYPQILLGQGDYEVSLLGYNQGYLYVRLMAQNIYTTQFYTKVETNTLIQQNVDSINLVVERKLDEEEFTGANIVLAINNDSSTATIDADKVSLYGRTIDLTADWIDIQSNNFSVDENGNMTCQNANVSGTITSNNATITGGNIHLTANGSNNPAVLLDTNSGASVLLTPLYNNQPALSINGSNGVEVVVGANNGIEIVNDGRVLFKVNKNNGKIFTDNTIESSYIYYNETVTSSPNMYITSNGNFRRTTNTSSQRYKKDIKDIESQQLNPERLYNLPIKQFKYKEEYQPNLKDSRYNKDLIGFIAEDVKEIYPIATDYNENGEVENWNERYMIPAMLKLIQEQHIEIEQMKKEIEKLKGGK